MEDKVLDYFNGDELAASTWKNKYAASGENTPDDTHKRLAHEFSRIEEKFRWTKNPESSLKLSNYGYSREHLTEEKIYNLFKDYKYIIPGGSVMSGAGTNGLVSLSNCFRGDVKVLTRDGFIPIKDLVGKNVEVFGGNKKWILSPIKSYGKQPLMKLTLRRNLVENKEIYCTKNHKWFVDVNRKIKETSELKSGDILSSQYGSLVKYNISHSGITRGILGFAESNCYPCIREDEEYLLGWLAGFFSIRGYITPTGKMYIKSFNKRDLEYIQNVCGVLGVFCSDIEFIEVDNCYKVNLNVGDFGKTFFISDQQRSYFSAIEREIPKDWEVVSVEDTDLIEEVYCAEVPEVHSFTIEGNILTHNCFVIGSPKDSYADIMKTRSEQAQLMKRRK